MSGALGYTPRNRPPKIDALVRRIRAEHAALEMLAALKAIEAALPELRADGTDRVVNPGSPRGMVRAAIAKAEGRT